MMKEFLLVFGALGAIVAVMIAIAQVAFEVKRRRVIRAAAAATDEQLDSIYRRIEALAIDGASIVSSRFRARR